MAGPVDDSRRLCIGCLFGPNRLRSLSPGQEFVATNECGTCIVCGSDGHLVFVADRSDVPDPSQPLGGGSVEGAE